MINLKDFLTFFKPQVIVSIYTSEGFKLMAPIFLRPCFERYYDFKVIDCTVERIFFESETMCVLVINLDNLPFPD